MYSNRKTIFSSRLSSLRWVHSNLKIKFLPAFCLYIMHSIFVLPELINIVVPDIHSVWNNQQSSNISKCDFPACISTFCHKDSIYLFCSQNSWFWKRRKLPLQDQKRMRVIGIRNSGPQHGVRSADVWKGNCFPKVTFSFLFSLIWWKITVLQISNFWTFLQHVTLWQGQTISSQTDQSSAILGSKFCPFRHSTLGLLALCPSMESGQTVESKPMWYEFYAQSRTK